MSNEQIKHALQLVITEDVINQPSWKNNHYAIAIHKIINENTTTYKKGRSPSRNQIALAKSAMQYMATDELAYALRDIFECINEGMKTNQDISREEYLLYNSLLYLWQISTPNNYAQKKGEK